MSWQVLSRWRRWALGGVCLVWVAAAQADDEQEVYDACKRAYQLDQQAEWLAAAREYESALALARRAFGANDKKTAAIQNNLANDYLRLREFAKAEPLYQQALKTREAKLGAEDPLVGETLHNLAVLYQAVEQKAKAEPLYQRCLKIAERQHGPDHLEVAQALETLAILHSELGRNDLAEPLFERCLKIREKKLGENHPGVSRSLNNLANVYQETGRYDQAEPLFQRSLKIKEAGLEKNHPEIAQTLCNLANLYCLMGKFDRAGPLYERSSQMLEKRFGPDHPYLARNLLNTANMHIADGQYDRAVPLVERSLKIFERRLPPEHPVVIECLDTLARVHSYFGQYDKSEPYYDRILKLREGRFGPQHTEVAACLNRLAAVQQAMGHGDDATETLDGARRIVREHVAQVLPVLNARGQLAYIQRIDQPDFHRALSVGLANADQPALAERSAGWLMNGKAVMLESLADHARLACDGRDPQLAEKIARLTDLRHQLAESARTAPDAGDEAAYQRRLRDAAEEERKLAREINSAAGRAALESTWIEPAAVRQALPRDSVLIEIARFKPFDFHAKPTDEPWRASRYVAWILPAEEQGKVRIIDLGLADEIDQAVERARTEIERPATRRNAPDGDKQAADEKHLEQAARKALKRLAELVLLPLLPAIGDARELVIATDSKLTVVPWAALTVTDDQYVIERWQVRYVTCGRDLVLNAPMAAKRPVSAPPAVFYEVDSSSDEDSADADQDDDDVERADDDGTSQATDGDSKDSAGEQPAASAPPQAFRSRMMKFESLDNCLEESSVRQILDSLAKESPIVYQGKKASETALEKISSPRVLVLSANGLYLHMEGSSGDTTGALTDMETQPHGNTSWSDDDRTLENPLSRAAVNLAPGRRGRQHEPGDGRASGIEIAGCDLRGTELVLLGACEPGLEPPAHDDFVALLLGDSAAKPKLATDFDRSCDLRQAFQLAGARAVLSFQWRMPDSDTAALLGDFFRQVTAGQDNAEALRSAQLARIVALRRAGDTAHPFHWAALRLTGN